MLEPRVSAWVTPSAISENRSLTIIILRYITLLVALRSDFFVCAVILNTKSRLGKSVNSFRELTLDQPAGSATKSMIVGYCLRSFYQFPKILFRDLSNLFTSASNSKQMLSHNDFVGLPFTNLIQLWFCSRQHVLAILVIALQR